MADDHPCRVVIVDDSADYRRVLEIMLELEGNLDVVGQAADGAQGIDVVREHQPDVVLLDVSMPVLDGIDSIPGIREAAPGTSIVMLTGFSSPAVREKALAAGASEYLDKGEPFPSILAAVRGNCRSNGGRGPHAVR